MEELDHTICRGKMEHRARQLMVDCSGCPGPARLEEKVCFMGLSGRLIPGFTGEVILMSVSDRRYSGGIVDALSSSSEILDMIGALGSDKKRSSVMGGGSKLTRSRGEIRSQYMSDPSSILEPGGSLDRLEKSYQATGQKDLPQEIERIREKIRRMKARL